MEPFIQHTGKAVVLARANVDTDAIIPSREIKTTAKTGLADGLFAPWRYVDADARTPEPSFVLNLSASAGCSILISGPNFGCGSSREHAVWALKEYGFKAIIAPSFGAIFANNCIRNGLLPMVLPQAEVDELAAVAVQTLRIDLKSQQLRAENGKMYAFALSPESLETLLTGLDPIAKTLQQIAVVDAFEAADRLKRPWIYELQR